MCFNKNQLHRRRSVARRKGAVVVEAALVLPVLLIITLGMIDIAQFITTAQCVTNASREAARFCSRADTKSASEVEAIAKDFLASIFSQHAGEIDSIVNVTVTDADGNSLSSDQVGEVSSGDGMAIDVTFDFSQVRWLPGPKYAAGNSLSSRTFCRRH